MRKFIKRFYFDALRPILQKIPDIGEWFTPVAGYFATLADWLAVHPNVPVGASMGKADTTWVMHLHPAEPFVVKKPEIAVPPDQTTFDGVPDPIHTLTPTYLAHFHWGYIASNATEVLTPDRYLIGDLMYAHPDVQEKLIFTPRMPIRPRVQRHIGSYATIFSHYANSVYGHWVRDGLTRLWLLEQSGITDYRLVLPPNLKPFHRNMLRLLGWTDDRLMPFDGSYASFEHLYVPSFASNLYWFPRPQAIRWLREKLTAAVPPPDSSLPKRILINRSKASFRRLVNQDEILAALAPYGFVDVIPESLSAEDQVRVFAGAEIVMGVSGSGLDNALCMPPGATVIELEATTRRDPDINNLCNTLDLRHIYITKTGLPDELSGAETWWVDWNFPVERILDALRQLDLAPIQNT